MIRGILAWLLVMLAETAHGVLRELLLVPHFGEPVSGRIGWPVGAAIVLAIGAATIRWTRIAGREALLRLGLAWAALTFIFEAVIGLARGLDAASIAAEINPLSGGLMLYTLVLMIFAPLIASQLRAFIAPP